MTSATGVFCGSSSHSSTKYRGDRGLNIGSYLSQWLANYYLSAAWHYAEGSLSAVRRSRRRQGEEIRRRLVTHVLFYADDILLIGRSKRDLTIAVKRLRGFLRDRLHLEIHSTWNVKHIGAESDRPYSSEPNAHTPAPRNVR